MPSELIKMPLDRIGVLIGVKGSTKKKIERISDCMITANSKTAEIEIEGKNAFNVHRCAWVIKAIARGFNPEKALYLMDEEYYLELINLKEILGKNEKAIHTKKARIIGTKGNIRKKIEKKTNCFISIYGKTVAVIGKIKDVDKAIKTIEMILNGAEFSSVDVFLNKRIRIRKGVEVI